MTTINHEPANGWKVHRVNEPVFKKLSIEAEHQDFGPGRIVQVENFRPSAEDCDVVVVFEYDVYRNGKSRTVRKLANLNEIFIGEINLANAMYKEVQPKTQEVQDINFDMLHPNFGLVAVVGETTDEQGNEMLYVIPAKETGMILAHGQVKFDVDMESFGDNNKIDPENLRQVICFKSELIPLGQIGEDIKPKSDRLYQACSRNSAEGLLAYGLDEFVQVIKDMPRYRHVKNNDPFAKLDSPEVLVVAEDSKRVFITKAFWLKDITTGESYVWTDPTTKEQIIAPAMFTYNPEEIYNEAPVGLSEDEDYASPDCITMQSENEDHDFEDTVEYNSSTVENLIKKHNAAVLRKTNGNSKILPATRKNSEKTKSMASMVKVAPKEQPQQVASKSMPQKIQSVPTSLDMNLIMSKINSQAPYWMNQERVTLEQLGATHVRVEFLVPTTVAPKIGTAVAKVHFKFNGLTYAVPVYYIGNRLLEVRSGSDQSKAAMCRLVSIATIENYLKTKIQHQVN